MKKKLYQQPVAEALYLSGCITALCSSGAGLGGGSGGGGGLAPRRRVVIKEPAMP